MSDFKAKIYQIVCWLGLCPRSRVYSVYLVYLYVLCNGPCSSPHYEIVPRPLCERYACTVSIPQHHDYCFQGEAGSFIVEVMGCAGSEGRLSLQKIYQK